MTDDERLCLQCPLPDCDEESLQCLLAATPRRLIEIELNAIEAYRHRRVVSAHRAIMRSIGQEAAA
jgi:hypothetical protein